jgi:exo-beta-1,3-glucanase (GH17 family)
MRLTVGSRWRTSFGAFASTIIVSVLLAAGTSACEPPRTPTPVALSSVTTAPITSALVASPSTPATALGGVPTIATPAATLTLIPSVTSTPQSALGQWQLSGDYIGMDHRESCAPDLPAGSFVLGAAEETCEPGARGGVAETTLIIPAAARPQVLMLHFACSSALCRDIKTTPGSSGSITVTIDNQPLWSARCDPTDQCPQLPQQDGPIVAFVTDAPSQHTIMLSAAPNTSWHIRDLIVEWRPVPSQIQGIAYSPFRDCQNPSWGPYPSEEQILGDLMLMRHMGNAIRTYSSTGIQSSIPRLARQAGLRVFAGAWLGPDRQKNDEEIASVIALARTGDVEAIIVGNEVLLRGDLPENELLGYIQRVKSEVHVPVTTAEIGAILTQHPRVMDMVDFHMVHLYAYWEGIPIENAARSVVDQYHRIQQQAGGKQVIIGETGWPSAGPARGLAETGAQNQRRFLREFLTLAQQESVEFFYFAAFDELWKTEGGVGPFWGYLGSDRRNKYDIQSLLVPLSEQIRPAANATPLPTGTPGPMPVEGERLPVYTTYAAHDNHFTPSGWMGDFHAIQFSDCADIGEGWTSRGIEIRYTPTPQDKLGWAGIYWLDPEDNWGVKPGGYDLRGFTRLRFRARSSAPGSTQIKFFVGGVANDPAQPDEMEYPSSIIHPITAQGADQEGFIQLTEQWQEFIIDLHGADLSYIIDGFGWVAERADPPKEVIFYLDDIIFER